MGEHVCADQGETGALPGEERGSERRVPDQRDPASLQRGIRIWLTASKNRSSASGSAFSIAATCQPTSANASATAARWSRGSASAGNGGSDRAKVRNAYTSSVSPTAYRAAARPGPFHIRVSFASPKVLGIRKMPKQYPR